MCGQLRTLSISYSYRDLWEYWVNASQMQILNVTVLIRSVHATGSALVFILTSCYISEGHKLPISVDTIECNCKLVTIEFSVQYVPLWQLKVSYFLHAFGENIFLWTHESHTCICLYILQKWAFICLLIYIYSQILISFCMPLPY